MFPIVEFWITACFAYSLTGFQVYRIIKKNPNIRSWSRKEALLFILNIAFTEVFLIHDAVKFVNRKLTKEPT